MAVVAKIDIEAGLRAVGLEAGDCVLVHSSLSSFGKVEGGAETVINALLQVVGAGGTVVMPAFTWNSYHHAHGAIFDVRHTPSECGKITEVFRLRPGVVRGPHVCHSMAAIGAYAGEMIGDTASPYGPGSAFAALEELNAWNLFLGVSFGCCTALHLVEERAKVPYRRYRDYADCTVIDAEGKQAPSRAVEFLRVPGFFNDFAKMGGVLEGHGVLHRAQVGNATLTNVRIRDVIRIAESYMRQDNSFLLGS